MHNTKTMDVESARAIAEYLANGGRVHRVDPGPRVSNAKLSRTGAECFFAWLNRRGTVSIPKM